MRRFATVPMALLGALMIVLAAGLHVLNGRLGALEGRTTTPASAIDHAHDTAPAVPGAPAVDQLTDLKIHIIDLQSRLAMSDAENAVLKGGQAPEAYKGIMETLQAREARVIADFEAAHPGWTLDSRNMRAIPTAPGGTP